MTDSVSALSLRAWLDRHGHTQSWLARQIGTQRANVQHWLAGRQRPSLGLAAALERLTDGEVRAVGWVEAAPKKIDG